MRTWYTGRELAGLPGMPKSTKTIREMGLSGRLVSRPRQVGKGSEYRTDSLPEETRSHLLEQDAGPASEGLDPRIDNLLRINEQARRELAQAQRTLQRLSACIEAARVAP